jgi:hypothetical protein
MKRLLLFFVVNLFFFFSCKEELIDLKYNDKDFTYQLAPVLTDVNGQLFTLTKQLFSKKNQCETLTADQYFLVKIDDEGNKIFERQISLNSRFFTDKNENIYELPELNQISFINVNIYDSNFRKTNTINVKLTEKVINLYNQFFITSLIPVSENGFMLTGFQNGEKAFLIDVIKDNTGVFRYNKVEFSQQVIIPETAVIIDENQLLFIKSNLSFTKDQFINLEVYNISNRTFSNKIKLPFTIRHGNKITKLGADKILVYSNQYYGNNNVLLYDLKENNYITSTLKDPGTLKWSDDPNFNFFTFISAQNSTYLNSLNSDTTSTVYKINESAELVKIVNKIPLIANTGIIKTKNQKELVYWLLNTNTTDNNIKTSITLLKENGEKITKELYYGQKFNCFGRCGVE